MCGPKHVLIDSRGNVREMSYNYHKLTTAATRHNADPTKQNKPYGVILSTDLATWRKEHNQ